ncbi:hypothetical protein [Secundilactobacillus silagei]|uniref:hypothetical protein n=1 Tax=Secundilactobacillus silagei TaxID=1293415 RepID=UPI00209216DB|nr:hypothetical protein [Secundilactobacillus silagei]
MAGKPKASDLAKQPQSYLKAYTKAYDAGKASYDTDEAKGSAVGKTAGLAGQVPADLKGQSQGYQDGYKRAYAKSKASYDTAYQTGQTAGQTDGTANKITDNGKLVPVIRMAMRMAMKLVNNSMSMLKMLGLKPA